MKRQSPKNVSLKKERIWELDALRGWLIFSMLIHHLYYTVEAFCIHGIYTKVDSYAYVNISDPLHFWFDWGEDGVIFMNFDLWGLLDPVHSLVIVTFFLISGISCTLSRDNLRRALIILAAAYGLSLFTYGIDSIDVERSRFIRFGILHCYGYSQLIYVYLLEKRSNRALLAASLPILLLGYWLRWSPVEWSTGVLLPFGIYEKSTAMWDYWPIIPYLGWLLIGVVIGRTVYRSKKTLLPRWNGRGMSWLCWLGKYSGIIYVFHIIVYVVVFWGIGIIFGLF